MPWPATWTDSIGRPQALVAAAGEVAPEQRHHGRPGQDGGGTGLGPQELAQRGLPAGRPRGRGRSRGRGGRSGRGSGGDSSRGAGLLGLGHNSIVPGDRIRPDTPGPGPTGDLALGSTLMRQDQPAAPDARVAAAAAHWGYRFTANGTDYGDFTATLARIAVWDDWCREWGVTAARYEQLAEAAEDAGERDTAAGAWRRAALAWHWGKFVFVDDPVQQRAAHDRSVACYRRAAAALTPPAELVRVPYEATELAAYLRVPAVPAVRAGDHRAAGRDHGPRPRLDQGGAAGHGRVPAGPGVGHARDRRPWPGRGRVRPADRACLRKGRHRRRRLPARPAPTSITATSACSA